MNRPFGRDKRKIEETKRKRREEKMKKRLQKNGSAPVDAPQDGIQDANPGQSIEFKNEEKN